MHTAVAHRFAACPDESITIGIVEPPSRHESATEQVCAKLRLAPSVRIVRPRCNAMATTQPYKRVAQARAHPHDAKTSNGHAAHAA